jgi:hypothetical protein
MKHNLYFKINYYIFVDTQCDNCFHLLPNATDINSYGSYKKTVKKIHI